MATQTLDEQATPSAPAASKGCDFFDSTSHRKKFISGAAPAGFNGSGVANIPLPIDISTPRPINRCYNPEGAVFKRISTTGTTNIGNNLYAQDRWLQITNSVTPGEIQVSQITGPTAPVFSKYGIQIKQTAAASKLFGTVQWLPSQDSLPLRGRTVTFQINNMNGVSIRLAILSWTGTADTLGGARDPIASWATPNESIPNSTFFKTTTQTLDGYIASTSATGVISITATVNSAANNVALVIWTAATYAQNATFQWSQAMLMDGAITQDYSPRLMGDEESLCDAFFYSTFARGTAPATNVGTNTGEMVYAATKTTTGALQYSAKHVFARRMRANPSAAIVTYNPAAANTQARDETAAGDCSATAVTNCSDTGLNFSMTGNAGGAVGNLIGLHFTADAEI